MADVKYSTYDKWALKTYSYQVFKYVHSISVQLVSYKLAVYYKLQFFQNTVTVKNNIGDTLL